MMKAHQLFLIENLMILKRNNRFRKKYSYLDNSKSPSNSVGYKPSKNFDKFKHRVQMLSLSNAFDEEDLVNFEKIVNFLNQKIFDYSVEPKSMGYRHL